MSPKTRFATKESPGALPSRRPRKQLGPLGRLGPLGVFSINALNAMSGASPPPSFVIRHSDFVIPPTISPPGHNLSTRSLTPPNRTITPSKRTITGLKWTIPPTAESVGTPRKPASSARKAASSVPRTKEFRPADNWTIQARWNAEPRRFPPPPITDARGYFAAAAGEPSISRAMTEQIESGASSGSCTTRPPSVRSTSSA